MQRILLALIRAYRYFLSPWLGGRCRFTPTCSVYARQAIELHGAGRGSWLAIKRILRCHPLCDGGQDPVPGLDPEPEAPADHDHPPSSDR